MAYLKIGVLFVVSVFLSGCASLGTYNPATHRRELIFISTPEEIKMGRAILKQLLASEKLSGNVAVVARVNRIGEKMVLVSDRQDYEYHFYVIEKNELNAFTIPGGYIFIYTGLLSKLKSDDEIAAVLAHEIGHCAARHTIKKYQAALGYDFVGNIIFSRINLSSQVKRLASMSSGALMNLVFSAYSRSDEYQADQLGLKYLELAGYDMNGMLEVFAVLQALDNQANSPLLLRSHPYVMDRIKAVKEEIIQMKSTGGFS